MEQAFKNEIDTLKLQIGEGRVELKESGAELSFAVGSTQSEYPHLDDAQRVQVIKKDT